MKLLDFDNSYIKLDNGCWQWVKGKQSAGYGMITIKNKRKLAHRYSYELFNKIKIPKGLCILHKCDNPSCVNPNHLFLGTQKDNIQDAIRKGRMKPPPHIGQAHHKLQLNEVKKIKKYLEQKLSYRRIAQRFNVAHGTIQKIANNITWRYI